MLFSLFYLQPKKNRKCKNVLLTLKRVYGNLLHAGTQLKYGANFRGK